MAPKTNVTTQENIKLMQLNWVEAEALAKPIRIAVFIEEQHVPESEEWDDEDRSAQHIIAISNGKAVATARLTQKGKSGECLY